MSNSFDFVDFARVVKSKRRIVLLAAGIFGAFALLLAVFLRPEYEARIVVIAASLSELRGKANSLGGIASLADLAGINVGNNDELEKSLATLSSRRFTDEFIRDEDILPVIYYDRWDAKSKSWKQRGGGVISALGREVHDLLRSLSGDEAPADGPTGASGLNSPSQWEAFKRFNDLREISRDRKTGLITLTIRWRDPVVAARWVNDMIDRANDELRNIALRESDERLAYLGRQLALDQTNAMREALVNLTGVEQRKAMIAHVQRAYAFTIVDPAVVPGERASPKRVALVFGGIVFGMFLGLAIVLFRYLLVRGPHRDRAAD
jgi:uncharacterized protein involved in exopolysaccharide biosynthesis